MPELKDTSERKFQYDVPLTWSLAATFDGLIGLYGPNRGEVIINLARAGLEAARRGRRLAELLEDARQARDAGQALRAATEQAAREAKEAKGKG